MGGEGEGFRKGLYGSYSVIRIVLLGIVVYNSSALKNSGVRLVKTGSGKNYI